MTMTSTVKKLTENMEKRSGASEDALNALVERSWVRLPLDYLDFLRSSNGAEGEVGDSYLGLWPAEEILSSNEGYNVREFVPGLLLFGSSMGGVAYAFDGRGAETSIVEVPFDSMDLSDVIPRGNTLEEFLLFLFTQWSRSN
jgi:hypothetical protein